MKIKVGDWVRFKYIQYDKGFWNPGEVTKVVGKGGLLGDSLAVLNRKGIAGGCTIRPNSLEVITERQIPLF